MIRPRPVLFAAALVNALAAGIAPIVGGALGSLAAEWALTLSWGSPDAPGQILLAQMDRLDFVFLAAFVVGLVALGRLARVREREREPPQTQVIKSLKDEVANVSTVKGMRYLTQTASFFVGLLLESGTVVTAAQSTAADDDEREPSS